MTEKEIYERVVSIARQADSVLTAVMQMDPTIELCIFTGKLSAAFDVLDTLVKAGVPVPDPGEEAHPLRRQ